MQDARNGQDKFGNLGVEVRTVLGHHLVGAFHGANRRGEDRAAGIFKSLTGLEQRLLADDAKARTSCTSLWASVMIQWRETSCAAMLPVFSMVMV